MTALLSRLKLLPLTCLMALWIPLVHAADFAAVLAWSELRVVSFPVNGSVIAVHVDAGERVSKGDKLIELDPEPNQIRVRELKAAVAAHQPALVDAEREYDHAQSLYEQTVLSDVELQKTKLAYDKAKAEVAQAQARLDLARWRLSMKTAYAPWDAIVIERNIEAGDMLVDEQRSKRWMVLAKADSLAASATVNPRQAASIRTGSSASISVAGKTYTGSVVAIEASDANAESYTLTVRIRLPDDGAFIAGMEAVIIIPD